MTGRGGYGPFAKPDLPSRLGPPCGRCGREIAPAPGCGARPPERPEEAPRYPGVAAAICGDCAARTVPQATPRARRLVRAGVVRDGAQGNRGSRRKARAYARRQDCQRAEIRPGVIRAFRQRDDRTRAARIAAAVRALSGEGRAA